MAWVVSHCTTDSKLLSAPQWNDIQFSALMIGNNFQWFCNYMLSCVWKLDVNENTYLLLELCKGGGPSLTKKLGNKEGEPGGDT